MPASTRTASGCGIWTLSLPHPSCFYPLPCADPASLCLYAQLALSHGLPPRVDTPSWFQTKAATCICEPTQLPEVDGDDAATLMLLQPLFESVLDALSMYLWLVPENRQAAIKLAQQAAGTPSPLRLLLRAACGAGNAARAEERLARTAASGTAALAYAAGAESTNSDKTDALTLAQGLVALSFAGIERILSTRDEQSTAVRARLFGHLAIIHSARLPIRPPEVGERAHEFPTLSRTMDALFLALAAPSLVVADDKQDTATPYVVASMALGASLLAAAVFALSSGHQRRASTPHVATTHELFALGAHA